MSRPSPAKDQLTICTQDCGARCCRYITVEVPAPLARADWDEMRWWLAHEGTFVSKDDQGWLLHMATRCKNLRADNACGIYPHHMGTCKEYDAAECEFTGELDHEFELHSELDLARYLERRKLKRAAPVAKDIRQAETLREAGGVTGLTQLDGLS
jgi:Fe-S-cluster containining protein